MYETPSSPSPEPASTRHAEFPTPQSFSQTSEPASLPTKVVEVLLDDDEYVEETRIGEDGMRTVALVRTVRPTKRPRRWLW